MPKQHQCVDCLADPPKTVRAAPYGGPRSRRCATHWRARKNANRLKGRERVAERRFGLSPGERAELLEAQGGRCPICQRGLDYEDARASGGGRRWRRTATDHDHACCSGSTSCGECVRGLTCGWCNTELLPRIDLAAARRLVAYYEDPPLARLRRARLEDVS